MGPLYASMALFSLHSECLNIGVEVELMPPSCEKHRSYSDQVNVPKVRSPCPSPLCMLWIKCKSTGRRQDRPTSVIMMEGLSIAYGNAFKLEVRRVDRMP